MTGLRARLRRNRQLNLYAYFAKDIASQFNLKFEDFGGCIYSVTTKSSAKKRDNEEEVDFVKRLMAVTRTENFFIDIKDMAPKEIYEDHMGLHKRSLLLRGGELPRKNLDYCFQYFSPCPYFSRCHGSLFTQLEK
jgi:hypothetical protein